MRALLIGILVLVLPAQSAAAAAWTLNRGQLQMFTGVITSKASHGFDDKGRPADEIVFSKMLVQNWMEYGLTDALTLFAVPEYVTAETDMDRRDPRSVHSASFEAGFRLLLSKRIGMLSLQVSGKTAGAFDMSVSASGAAGRYFDLRLLNGRSFRLFRRDAFLDLQAAERWIQKSRPNELILDATAGLWITKDELVMIQSFNTISHGTITAPYVHYRLHKLQASLVEKVTPHWSLQSGYFLALAGRNVVQEQGFVATIWYRS